MNSTIFITIIFILVFSPLFSQQPEGESGGGWRLSKYGITATANSGGLVQRYTNPQTNEKSTFTHIAFLYSVGFNVRHNVNVGLLGFHGFVSGNLHPNLNYYGMGAYARYYALPRRKDFLAKKADSSFVRKFYLNHVKVFGEGGYLLTNHLPEPDRIIRLDGLRNNMFYLTIGTHIRVWKGVGIEYGFRTIYLPERARQKIVFPRYPDLGLVVYF